MQRTPWIKRKFHFKIPPGWLPNIIERLRGTESRLRLMTKGITDSGAGLKFLEKWSIKENIGHLTDLESLHMGRINDLIFKQPVLRAADMTNTKTNLALHNTKDVETLIEEFSEERANFIKHLLMLDELTQQFTSQHPRLKTAMRPVDMAYFTAEHDDHHLASIRIIINHLET